MIMASNKTEIDHHHHQHHDTQQQTQIYSYHQQDIGMMQPSSSSTPFSGSLNNINKNDGSYDLSELDDQALFLFLDGQDDQSAQNSEMTPPTLNIFPSQPMHVEPSKGSSSGLVSPVTSGSNKSSERYMELSNPNSDVASAPQPHKVVKCEGSRKGHTSGNERPKTHDPKIMRRLAQNREAARKSRLRKKAYVQQLESSRMRLAQLEQELQRARSQGSLYLGGNNLFTGDQGISGSISNINSEAAVFDMEYSRWLEEHLQMMVDLRKAVQDQLPEHELQVFVDKCLGHYNQLMNLKSMKAKSDVFHSLSGMWKTPAERCFLWIGDFRPSEIIKVSISQLEPLTGPQFEGICRLQQSTNEAEEALSRGLEALNNSVSDTISSDSLSTTTPNMNTYMGSMALAINKLSSLEGIVRQADSLRYETLHRLRQILTTFQVARCLLAMAEYFHRLRTLNSIWNGRPHPES